MRVVSLVMAGRDSDLPRKVVVAVTAERVYVLRPTRRNVAAELASWDRSQLRASAQASRRGWSVWLQPPGERPGFELRGRASEATGSVVAAVTGVG